LWYPDQALRRAEQQATAYLHTVCARHARAGSTLRPQIVEGDPASRIVEVATTEGVDAIVMTTHGYSGFTYWVMGSVTERVVRAATCPILVVRDARPIRHILVPVDGSLRAEQALLPALALARRLDATATLLHVLQPTFVLAPRSFGWEYLSLELDMAMMATAEQDARRYVTELAERHAASEVTIRTIVRGGTIAETILHVAESEKSDVIAMATHGRTGLRRWVYGSVAEKVLHRVPCTLLIVRVPAHMLRDDVASLQMPASARQETEKGQPEPAGLSQG
jgi:nucleotide-binding universal stress UspA family protein